VKFPYKLPLFILVFIFLIPSILSLGAETKYEDYTGGSDTTTLGTSTWKAMTFTVGTTGTDKAFNIKKVRLSMQGDGSTGTTIVGIRNVDGSGEPIGEDIANGTLSNADTPTGSLTWQEVNMTTPITLAKGTQYAIVVRSGSPTLTLEQSNAGGYGGGNEWTSVTAGNTWADNAPIDFQFEVYGSTSEFSIETELIAPANLTGVLSSAVFNISSGLEVVGFSANITNVTLFIWNSTNDLVNTSRSTLQTVVTNTTLTNYTIFPAPTITVGEYTWNAETCYENNTAGGSGCVFAPNNLSFTYGFIKNAETFDASVGDLSTTDFTLNLTLSEEILLSTVNLHYNGTRYTTTRTAIGDDQIYTLTIDTPAVLASTAMTFFWEIILKDGFPISNTNTTAQTQTITPSNLFVCALPTDVRAINFTIYREDAPTTLITADNFEASFSWKLDPSSSTTKNTSITLTAKSNVEMCITPNSTFYVDSTVEVREAGYSTRIFEFSNKQYNNVSTTQNLYLLNTTSSTSFILFVRDSAFIPISEAIIEVERLIVANNTYILVESAKTDQNGKSVGHFLTEDASYRFKVYVDDSLKLTTLPGKIVCESEPCTVTLTLPADVGDGLDNYEPIQNLVSTLTYDKTTQIVTYTYTDTDTTAQGGRLEVIHWDYGNVSQTVVCNTTSTEVLGNIQCDLSAFQNGTYLVNAYNNRVDAPNKLDKRIIVAKIRDIIGMIGDDGLLWTAFLVVAIVMVGLFKPAIAIFFAVGGVFLMSLVGIASISTVSLISIGVIGVIFLWEMRK